MGLKVKKSQQRVNQKKDYTLERTPDDRGMYSRKTRIDLMVREDETKYEQFLLNFVISMFFIGSQKT